MTLESCLTYVKGEKREFVHDKYKEIYLARWFATRINDVRLTVEQCWKDYWSYEENAELWGLPKGEWRGLLPKCKALIYRTLPLLEAKKEQLICQMVGYSYFVAKDILPKYRYNPFEDNYYTMLQILARSCIPLEDMEKKLFSPVLRSIFNNELNPGVTYDYLERTNPILHRLLTDKFPKTWEKIGFRFGGKVCDPRYRIQRRVHEEEWFGFVSCRYGPSIRGYIEWIDELENDEHFYNIPTVSGYHIDDCINKCILDLRSKNAKSILTAGVVLYNLNHYDKRFFNLLLGKPKIHDLQMRKRVLRMAQQAIIRFSRDKQNAYQIITDINEIFANTTTVSGYFIRIAHKNLKPRGLNPPIKKLLT